MQCEEVRPRLDAYIDGELAEAERVPLRDHLQDCPDCGPEVAALERLRDDIRQFAPVYRAPEALRSQIRFAIRREAAANRPSASLRAPGWLAYAASILLAVAVGSRRNVCADWASGRNRYDRRRDHRQPSALPARHPPDRCRVLGSAHGQAVVCRPDRAVAADRRTARGRLSAGWRPARPDRRETGPGAGLQAPRPRDQSVRAAGLAGRSSARP